jgi:MFS transporter, DHA1 family, tetracycline resistance protein
MSPATDVGGGRRSIVPLLVATVFLDLVGFGIVVPQLPLAAARFEDRGLIVGLLVATDSLLSFFLAPQWGRLSDRIGRRPVILIGLAASAVSYAMFGLAPSLAILFLSRVISGGFGATVNVSQAFLADVTPGARRSQAMGFVGAAFGVGFTIGPIIGGLAARSSVAAPGLVAAAICGINFLLALVFLPESRERATREWSQNGSVPRQAALIAFGVSLAFTTVYVVFQRFARDELGLSRSAISYCFAVLGLVTAIVQGRLVGKLAPRVGERRLIMWGATLVAAGLLTILGSARVPASAAIATLVAGVALLSAGYSLVGPCVAGVVSRMTSGDEQGRALGALQSVGTGARITGPPLLGFLSERGGFELAFGTATAAAIAAAVVGRRWKEPTAAR